MYPRAFRYERATSIEHAIALLEQYGEDARLLAGGASLIPLMKLRLAAPTVLVDLGRLDALSGLRWDGDALAIGALTRHADVEVDRVVATRLPLVHEAAAGVGDTQVRNMGTVGGALAEADPAGDWAPVLLAGGGHVRVVGPAGARTIAATDLFIDAYTTALGPSEVLVEAVFPATPRAAEPDRASRRPPVILAGESRGERTGSAHLKFEIRAGDFAVANCAVAVTLDADGRCAAIGIGLGGVGLIPLRVAAAEAVLRGEAPRPARVAEAAALVRTCTDSYDDVRGSAAYRQHLGGVLFERALALALQRATSGQA